MIHPLVALIEVHPLVLVALIVIGIIFSILIAIYINEKVSISYSYCNEKRKLLFQQRIAEWLNADVDSIGMIAVEPVFKNKYLIKFLFRGQTGTSPKYVLLSYDADVESVVDDLRDY